MKQNDSDWPEKKKKNFQRVKDQLDQLKAGKNKYTQIHQKKKKKTEGKIKKKFIPLTAKEFFDSNLSEVLLSGTAECQITTMLRFYLYTCCL